jgi:hypothetical protein
LFCGLATSLALTPTCGTFLPAGISAPDCPSLRYGVDTLLGCRANTRAACGVRYTTHVGGVVLDFGCTPKSELAPSLPADAAVDAARD